MSASELQIDLEANRAGFEPGDSLNGRVSWALAKKPKSVEVRLFWYTKGKGTTDVCIVETKSFSMPGVQGKGEFSFVIPQSPYSFSGKLVSLVWALELVSEPSSDSRRVEIVIAPRGKEVVISRGEMF